MPNCACPGLENGVRALVVCALDLASQKMIAAAPAPSAASASSDSRARSWLAGCSRHSSSTIAMSDPSCA